MDELKKHYWFIKSQNLWNENEPSAGGNETQNNSRGQKAVEQVRKNAWNFTENQKNPGN